MTFEELKEEAARQGYRLVKFKKYIRIEPCTCGSRKRLHFTKWDGKKLWISLKCISCGKEALGENEEDAKLNWNEMILEERGKLCVTRQIHT